MDDLTYFDDDQIKDSPSTRRQVFNKNEMYSRLLEEFRNIRETMRLGQQTLKAENNLKALQERSKLRLERFGFYTSYDPYSAFDRYEQIALRQIDANAKNFTNTFNYGIGAAQLGLNIASFYGLGETKFGNRLGTASFISSLLGFNQASGVLGNLSYYSSLAGLLQIPLTLLQGGINQRYIDPFQNIRYFAGTILGGTRGILGGTQSNRAYGGLDIATSFDLARQVQNLVVANRDLTPDQINNFLKAATQMPQLQYVQNIDQATRNISKFMDIFISLSKQFKGKENEMVEAIRQFSTMGLSIEQSRDALLYTTRMGRFLNVNPANFVNVGANAIQSFMLSGTLGNVNQGTILLNAMQNYTLAERMRQSGSLNQVQLMNFGGTQGVAEYLTKTQIGFLQSDMAKMFLRSIYNPNVAGGIDREALQKILSGQYNLADVRSRANEIVLNPKSSMDFIFMKDFLIGNLGENTNAFTYAAWNMMFRNKSPFGRDLFGRARWLQMYMNMDPQTALLNATAWMNYNPIREKAMQDLQFKQSILENNPYFSSQTPIGRWFNQAGVDISRFWSNTMMHSPYSPFSYFNPESRPFERLWNFFGDLVPFGRETMEFYRKTMTPYQLRPFYHLSNISSKEAVGLWSELSKNREKARKYFEMSDEYLKNRELSYILSYERATDFLPSGRPQRSMDILLDEITEDLDKVIEHYDFEKMDAKEIMEKSGEIADILLTRKNIPKSWYNVPTAKPGETINLRNIVQSKILKEYLPKDKQKLAYSYVIQGGKNALFRVTNPFTEPITFVSPTSNVGRQIFGKELANNIVSSRTGLLSGENQKNIVQTLMGGVSDVNKSGEDAWKYIGLGGLSDKRTEEAISSGMFNLTPEQVKKTEEVISSGMFNLTPEQVKQAEDIVQSGVGNLFGTTPSGDVLSQIGLGGIGTASQDVIAKTFGVVADKTGYSVINKTFNEAELSKSEKRTVEAIANMFSGLDTDYKQMYENYKMLKDIAESDIEDVEAIPEHVRQQLKLPSDVDLEGIKKFIKAHDVLGTERRLGLIVGDIKPETDEEKEWVTEQRKGKKYLDFITGMKEFYSSAPFKKIATEVGANENLFSNILQNYFTGSDLDTFVGGKEEFKRLKKMIQDTGFGEISKYLTYQDGQVSLRKDLSPREEKAFQRALNNMFSRDKEQLEQFQMKTADQIWEKRGFEAKTIQDFAVAVAKGLEIWSSGSSELEHLRSRSASNRFLQEVLPRVEYNTEP